MTRLTVAAAAQVAKTISDFMTLDSLEAAVLGRDF
jgi:hypothetical protein